jgi:hypothetical protein
MLGNLPLRGSALPPPTPTALASGGSHGGYSLTSPRGGMAPPQSPAAAAARSSFRSITEDHVSHAQRATTIQWMYLIDSAL